MLAMDLGELLDWRTRAVECWNRMNRVKDD
jgi:hypothetical protein